jgi:hypothetical protein
MHDGGIDRNNEIEIGDDSGGIGEITQFAGEIGEEVRVRQGCGVGGPDVFMENEKRRSYDSS